MNCWCLVCLPFRDSEVVGWGTSLTCPKGFSDCCIIKMIEMHVVSTDTVLEAGNQRTIPHSSEAARHTYRVCKASQASLSSVF